MGRKIPSAYDPSISVHQTVTFSLLLAGMALVIAVSTTLCGVRFRRRKRPSSVSKSSYSKSSSSESSSPSYKPEEHLNMTNPSSPSPLKIKIETSNSTASQQRQAAVESETAKEKQHIEDESERKEAPLTPPKPLRQTFSCKNLLTKSGSTRNIVRNMSMKLPRNISNARGDKEDGNHQQKGKLKNEDSIWMKTIILGERCKVPDDDQEAVIYDSRGNRISTYHPKTPKSLPVSRQNSFT